MPIFEYECRKCTKVFEKLVSLSRREAVACPHCGSRRAKKLFSTFMMGRGGGKEAAPVSSGRSCASCSAESCATCH